MPEANDAHLAFWKHLLAHLYKAPFYRIARLAQTAELSVMLLGRSLSRMQLQSFILHP